MEYKINIYIYIYMRARAIKEFNGKEKMENINATERTMGTPKNNIKFVVSKCIAITQSLDIFLNWTRINTI
jgi:hypothetical protein